LKLINVFIFLFLVQILTAQTLPVSTPVLGEYLRRQQLLGDSVHPASLMLLPVFQAPPTDKWIELKRMPLIWKQVYTSDHPFNFNDGAMIPNRGYQTMLSTGLFFRAGILSVQLMPEFVYAENREFDGLSTALNKKVWNVYNIVKNDIDLPYRFGNKPYQKLFWGQSSARLTYKSLSLGISNENLWWGPGMKNTLLMTNNAPGFRHVSFNTVKPVKTPIGSFEWQIIGGRLEASGYPGVDTVKMKELGIRVRPKRNDWRYLNAMTVNYQPGFLPGLVLGATRSFTIYGSNITNNYRTWFPLFEPLMKTEVGPVDSDTIPSDQLASVYARWIMPESHSEFYLEFGRTDHSWDFTDFVLEPDHYRAYIAGFRKMVPLHKKRKEFLDFQTEITVFNRSYVTSLRVKNSPAAWYIHGQVRHGYTHLGQILGSGIGISSNMQTASLSWVRGMKRVGLELMRYAHDEDFWAYISQTTGYGDYRTHWVDLGAALLADWDFKKLLVSFKLYTLGSINYMFHYDPIPSDPPFWWDRGKVRYNVFGELGVVYLF